MCIRDSCRTLCSYAIKFKSYQPLFINLNPHEGIFSPPGCLTATPISDILDVQSQTWGQSMTSGATELHSKQPIVKNFGLENISENRSLYWDNMNQLSNAVNERLQNDVIVQRSGCILNTPSLSDLDEEFNELVTIIDRFKVNIVVVLAEQDEFTLFEKVKETLRPYIGDFLIRLPKLSGRFEADDAYKRSLQRTAIKEYFYGTPKTILSPYASGADFEEITVWKPINMVEAQGTTSTSNPLQLLPVTVDASTLQHALVAISYADRKSSSSEVQKASILGFGLITEVNEKKRKIRILLPVPGRLPNKAMILTSYRYLE